MSKQTATQKFPKSARLRTKKDFRFRPFKKRPGRYFLFVYNEDGLGRLGISISKKVLKKATARNRVKRLLKEAYRKLRHHFPKADIHIIGLETLSDRWEELELVSVSEEFQWLIKLSTKKT